MAHNCHVISYWKSHSNISVLKCDLSIGILPPGIYGKPLKSSCTSSLAKMNSGESGERSFVSFSAIFLTSRVSLGHSDQKKFLCKIAFLKQWQHLSSSLHAASTEEGKNKILLLSASCHSYFEKHTALNCLSLPNTSYSCIHRNPGLSPKSCQFLFSFLQ